MGTERIATVDIGTNTLLLLVVEPGEAGELSVLADECRFGRLGKGVDASGALDPAAIQRSLDALRAYRDVLDRLGVTRVGAVGTQALREARNAAEFTGPARQLLGTDIEIITGEREAHLVATSLTRSLPELADRTIVTADVGGGSTEINVLERGELRSFVSVPIGSVRLTERFLHGDPPRPDEIRALIAHIDEALAPLELPSEVPLVATAGTATTMASVELKLLDYDRERLHGVRLAPSAVERQLATYLELTVAERKHLRGLEPERADVIAAGAAIFARLMHRVRAPEMLVSSRGVRWGLAYELADVTR